MDVQTRAFGLQNVVASGQHSLVVSHTPMNNCHQHYHSLPPARPLPKTTSSYELVQLVPTAVYVPVQEQRQTQNHARSSRGNYICESFDVCIIFLHRICSSPRSVSRRTASIK